MMRLNDLLAVACAVAYLGRRTLASISTDMAAETTTDDHADTHAS